MARASEADVLLKSVRTSHFDEESPYHTLPKRSFTAVARHNLGC